MKKNYYWRQLDYIHAYNPSKKLKIQVYNGTDGTKTNWIDLNSESTPVLIEFLESLNAIKEQ